jgi:hypothetical protein
MPRPLRPTRYVPLARNGISVGTYRYIGNFRVFLSKQPAPLRVIFFFPSKIPCFYLIWTRVFLQISAKVPTESGACASDSRSSTCPHCEAYDYGHMICVYDMTVYYGPCMFPISKAANTCDSPKTQGVRQGLEGEEGSTDTVGG